MGSHGKRKVVEFEDCWARMNWPRGCAGRLVVPITSISPSHRRSLDHALDDPSELVAGWMRLFSTVSLISAYIGVGLFAGFAMRSFYLAM